MPVTWIGPCVVCLYYFFRILILKNNKIKNFEKKIKEKNIEWKISISRRNLVETPQYK